MCVTTSLPGAGHTPRHTDVFSSLDAQPIGGQGSSGTNQSGLSPPAASLSDFGQLVRELEGSGRQSGGGAERSLLNHADWGVKQWLPFLVGGDCSRPILRDLSNPSVVSQTCCWTATR